MGEKKRALAIPPIASKHNTQFWSRDTTCYKAGALSPITLNQKWEHSLPQRNSDTGMGGIRKSLAPSSRTKLSKQIVPCIVLVVLRI